MAYQPSSLSFIDITVDATGALVTVGGLGGGGATTIVDGGDVAQGATTDLASASTVVGILKNIKAALAGTLTVGLPAGASTEATLALIKAKTDNIDVALSTRTKPADAQHAIIDSGTLTTLTTLTGITNVVHVDDNAGSLTVDAPVATPLFARLSDGAAALVGQKTMALSLPVAVASDQSAIPTKETPATLCVTATAATGVAATATLPAVAGQFHYITAIEIEVYATAARTGAAGPLSITTTNLTGGPAWWMDTAQAIGAVIRKFISFPAPVKSTTVNTATTIVAPVAVTGQWRINVYYYTAA